MFFASLSNFDNLFKNMKLKRTIFFALQVAKTRVAEHSFFKVAVFADVLFSDTVYNL